MFRSRSRMAKERLKICYACPSRVGVQCGVCFCFLHAKAESEEEECPLNKWK